MPACSIFVAIFLEIMVNIDLAKMQQIADALADEGWFAQPDFLTEELASALLNITRQNRDSDAFRRAGIGTGTNFQLNREIRGDSIYWISRHPQEKALIQWVELMNQVREGINKELFLGLRDLEMHMAIYPPGTHYQRHLDQFSDRSNRVLSVVLYLTPNWQAGMGGELVIYRDHKEPVIVEPKAGTFVCFLSDQIEHEVLTTHIERHSITGWMLRKPIGLGFL
jgi:SM-20-related protein